MRRVPGNLGQAELEILKIVQERQPITVGELAQLVAAEAGKARTTVATMVGRLLAKGFLSRKKIEGKFHYSARLNQDDLLSGLVRSFVEKTLGGSTSPLVAYLAENPDLTPDELAELQRLVKQLAPSSQSGRS